MPNAKPIPEGYHTVTPYLVVADIGEAIEFYKKAFGARETVRQKGPDGKLMHGEVAIGNSRVMLGPVESCEAGAVKGCQCALMLYVEDVAGAMERAIAAGAKESMAVEEMFWGDRMGQVADPFGHSWSICTHVEDLTPEQITQRAQEYAAAKVKR